MTKGGYSQAKIAFSYYKKTKNWFICKI